jgi:hypothetical protein
MATPPQELKQLRAARGYSKSSITRLYNFVNNREDVELTPLSTLQSKRTRIVELFAEYESYNKKILAYDDADSEDVADCEAKYYHILTVLNEAIKDKSSPSSEAVASCHNFKARLPAVQVEIFSGKYRDYTPFINLFRAIIHNDRSIDNVQKLYYLRSFLSKEPYDIVKDLPLTMGSYDEALKLLDERYNHTSKIVNEHINSLLDINALCRSTPGHLREFVSSVKQCLSALKNLSVNTENWDPIILAILYRKLDSYTSRAYQLERSDANDPTVADFLLFMEKRALALENADAVAPGKYHKAVVNVTAAPAPGLTCTYCKSAQHKIFECNKFKLASPGDRIAYCKNNSLCNVCLNAHRGKCRFHFRCNICKETHNTLLHQEPTQVNTQATQPVSLISTFNSNRVLLPTVKVKLLSKTGQIVHVKAILDSASQISLVTSKVIHTLGVAPNNDNTSIVGVSNSNASAKYSVPLEIASLATPYKVTTNFHVLDNITCKIPQYKIDTKLLNIPSSVNLADEDFYKPSEINMLLGADVFFQALLPEPQAAPRQPGLQFAEHLATQPRFVNTKFGHVIAGALPRNANSDTSKVSLLCVQCDSSLNDSLQQFWKAEKIPETYCESMSEHEQCERIFQDTTVFENNRFQVDLPLKVPLNEVNDVLGCSFDIAYYRFLNLEKKLQKNVNLLTDYDKFINEYVDLKHAHYVDFSSLDFENDPLYFAAHQAVTNPHSKTTPTRVVFDCSMQTNKKIALNDILLNGAPLQRELFDIMLLFRLGEYTFSTDIRRMFRCININPIHAKLQNILWRSNPNDPLKCIQLDSVTYGQKSSTFLSTRCLQELSNRYHNEFPLASYILNNCTYVDDACFSHSDLNVIIEARLQLCELLAKGSFHTHKWASNDHRVLEGIPNDKQHFDSLDFQKDLYLKTLGLKLNMQDDCFVFSCPEPFDKQSPTKKDILSHISKFYDPLGFIAPIIMKAKAFMQKVYSEKIGWNEVPSPQLREEWFSFANKLTQMKPLTINRYLQIPSNATALQLIGFADACSTTGYGCCVYLRVVDEHGNASLSLLCAKSRINPRNKDTLTIARLELCSMLLLSKLINRVYETLKPALNIQGVYLFSDSQIALAWVNTEPIKLQAFVANRVRLIRDLTDKWRWLYVPSEDNASDCVSRGADPDELHNTPMWLHGPTFLHDGKYEFDNTSNLPAVEDLPELKKAPSSDRVTLITQKGSNFYEFLDNFSDLNKMVRVMAYINRFCNNLKNKNTNSPKYITPSELKKALLKIIKHEQGIYFRHELDNLKANDNVKGTLNPLHPFLDDQGILRVGGRIKNANVSFSQKHPIILPRESRITNLIVHHEHIRLLHAPPKLLLSSLNEKYWIVNGLSYVKKIVSKCLPCFRMKAQCAKQLMGSLPPERVNACRVFQKIGIDFAGPITVKNSRVRRALQTKGYICVFVCFVTKAIHLELSSDLTTDAFLACFKRFIARRGLPTDVFCDNGGSFKGAENKLNELYNLNNSKGHQTLVQSYAAQQNIAFHFVPSYSPVFAGLAEAAVKSTKYHLKRVLQSYVLTYEQLNTILCQIEAVLNSRPLLPVTANDVNDYSYLSAGHFLIGAAMTSLPEADLADSPTNRLKFWEMCNKVKGHFWKVWHKYYLNVLQCRPKWRDSKPNVQVGALVIMKEPNSPPMTWPMARIVKVYPGDDNKVRVVDLMTPNKKVYRRSLSGFAVLPLE